MRKSVSKKLKQLAHVEIAKVYEREEDIIKHHANTLKFLKKPKYMPARIWFLIVDKVINR